MSSKIVSFYMEIVNLICMDVGVDKYLILISIVDLWKVVFWYVCFIKD